ncbi:MAG TPA: NUDIX domain-containing protein [Candidatus Nanoarchaeia archaeon]|nr:NUDIX domain-containing protein [Candidatus Nanoarchaeia archaeon]
MKKSVVILAYLRHDNHLLLLKRSSNAPSFPDHWSVVSGHVEESDADSLIAAVREVFEETGITADNLRLVNRLEPFEVVMSDRSRVVHSFLFDVLTKDVSLNSEHADFAWIDHKSLKDFSCVEGVDTVWKMLHNG